MKIQFVHKGNFNHMEKFLTKSLKLKFLVRPILEKYGRKGVEALKMATPKDSGKTAESWTYEIVEENGKYSIVWSNTNTISNGKYQVNVAILLQYGHATKNGGFVQGIDFVNPAIASVFQQMADEAWKEVAKSGK